MQHSAVIKISDVNFREARESLMGVQDAKPGFLKALKLQCTYSLFAGQAKKYKLALEKSMELQ